MRRKVFKAVMHRFYRPLVQWYLRKERMYKYRKITLHVPPGVFHPGLFYSTRIMSNFIAEQPIAGKTLLELGSGAGMIAIYAAKQGAKVTATDISQEAVVTIKRNAAKNNADINVIWSDLFQDIPQQAFDYTVVNPPYYKGKPNHEHEFAWYAGQNHEYFQLLFAGLGGYIHPGSHVYMVISDEADIEAVKDIAAGEGYQFIVRFTKTVMLERQFIFEICSTVHDENTR